MSHESDPSRRDSGRTVGEIWSEKLASPTAFSRATFWLALPRVQQRVNAKASRGFGHWVNYCVSKYVGSRAPVDRMLSVGCGAGDLERHIAALGAFRHCDAWDVAADGIAKAEQLAQEAGYRHITYAVKDIATTPLPPHAYDAIWFNSSLHHIEPLEKVYAAVSRSLKPDGLVFVNEYVGANAFAFGERQNEAIRAAFHLIPNRFRRSFLPNTSEYLNDPLLPTPREVRAADPSEAIRSADIIPLLHRYFEVLEANEVGGSLLQFVLHGIAGNFDTSDQAPLRILDMLFDVEDALIESGDLASDFVLIVARPRPNADDRKVD